MTEPVVWPLTPTDAPLAGAVLERAFRDEPLLLEAFPDLADRGEYFQRRWAATTRLACQDGEAWAVGPEDGDLAGVALWFREPSDPPGPALKAELDYPVDPDADAAMQRIFAMMEPAEAGLGALPQTWRYLAMIGIDPAVQGQGFGSRLLRRLLDDAAVAGEVLALVTSRPRNVSFYQHAGMNLVWSGRSDGGMVPLWSFRTRVP